MIYNQYGGEKFIDPEEEAMRKRILEGVKEKKDHLNKKLKDMQETKARELTFGEKAVGITFNPGGNPIVNAIKEQYAKTIDLLYEARELTTNGDMKRMLSVAITEAQTSQMWAVKAVTWQY